MASYSYTCPKSGKTYRRYRINNSRSLDALVTAGTPYCWECRETMFEAATYPASYRHRSEVIAERRAEEAK